MSFHCKNRRSNTMSYAYSIPECLMNIKKKLLKVDCILIRKLIY